MKHAPGGPSRPRHFGKPPFRVVVVHGGPGAPGTLAPVARELGRGLGVLEPWQTAPSVPGEVDELFRQITTWADPPVVLVGHSWGAWLSLLLAAEHPRVVHGLVLVGCGPLASRYASEVGRARRARLSAEQQRELERCERRLAAASRPPSATALRRLGDLARVTDSYDLLPHRAAVRSGSAAVFRSVWKEAESMRRAGRLIRAARRVRAPIVVIHGDADPHPLRGVVEPLHDVGIEPRVVLLSRCGHEPWWERHARVRFFEELRAAVDVLPVAGTPPRVRGRPTVK